MSLLSTLIQALVDVDRRLSRIEHKEDAIMGAIEDLQAIDTELASTVTDLADTIGGLADDVDRLDGDFVKLEQAVGSGNTDAINAEVANLRTLVDSAKASADRARAAKANIDTTDPQPTPPADGTQPPADGSGDSGTPAA